MLVYSLLYCVIQVPFFLIMSIISDAKHYGTLVNFSDFNKFFFSSSYKLAISFSFFFISGLPPFLLFVYKYILLTQMLLSGYFVVVVFMVFMNVVSLIYYLRIIKTILFEENNSISFDTLKFINENYEKNFKSDLEILRDFSFYLSLTIFFSIYLFVYFDEIQSYLIDNSENFLNLKYK